MSRLRLTMVIPSAEQAVSNQKSLDDFTGDTDLDTFTVGLSPTGQLPVTHYWCCWGGLTGAQFGKLRAGIGGIPGSHIYVTPNALENPKGNEKMPRDVLVELGLRPIEEEVP